MQMNQYAFLTGPLGKHFKISPQRAPSVEHGTAYLDTIITDHYGRGLQ